MSDVSDRIWSEPLTDSERTLALKAFLLGSTEVSQWGNFLLKVYDAREAEVVRLRTALEQLDALLNGPSARRATFGEAQDIIAGALCSVDGNTG